MRIFNTEGPIVPKDHYCIRPLDRVDLDEILALIRWKKYFVLHAPRQTGETTVLGALLNEPNNSGKYRCVYVNVEVGQAAHNDVGAAMRAILYVLAEWSAVSRKPLVLLIDEIDSLVSDTLISVLRQLRSGYRDRPRRFPQSIVLCSVRDVRDYRIRSSSGEIVLGGSACNIKAESLRLGEFSKDEVRELLGQAFAEEAVAEVWQLTQGQPWLVNALAYEACFRNKAARDRSRPITLDAVRKAREHVVPRRDTHPDQLVDKLQEPRVRRVIEPLLSGGLPSLREDDLEYVRDIGLVARSAPVAIANPIYREVTPRELTSDVQATLANHTKRYVGEDGSLLVPKLLAAFQEYFRENAEHWVDRFAYKEAGPQLLLQAFLQRIVNSRGRIEREYGLGRRRTHLLIVWPTGGSRDPMRVHMHVIECKVVRKGRSREGTIQSGLVQTADYTDGCGAQTGHLVAFDRRQGKSWDEKLFRREETAEGRAITVWGM